MFVLFENPAGYGIFKVLKESILQDDAKLQDIFSNPKKLGKAVKLLHFHKFQDNNAAVAATNSLIDGLLGKDLKKMLKKVIPKDGQLGVVDAKLGSSIAEKLNLNIVSNNIVNELVRGIRGQTDVLIPGISAQDTGAMALGLAHSLSRYKLKFSADKIDVMIVQAINLLDTADKEINNAAMRLKEWYGWHFPEMSKLISDNSTYAKAVQLIGNKENAENVDLSSILSEEDEKRLKEAARLSIGNEIAEDEMSHVYKFCVRQQSRIAFREELFGYLKMRMMTISPNLTTLVGDIIGARLIAHAGSLISLAKQPASTVQIYGAEKALFRAMKTKHDTPKFGILYHASLIGQSSGKMKGKMSRSLAAKTALAVRLDALGEDVSDVMGAVHKAKLESRLQVMQDQSTRKANLSARQMSGPEKYEKESVGVKVYNSSIDSTLLPVSTSTPLHSIEIKKRKHPGDTDGDENYKKVKKESVSVDEDAISAKKTKKKRKREESAGKSGGDGSVDASTSIISSEIKKKKKEMKVEEDSSSKKKKELKDEDDSISPEKKKKKKEVKDKDDSISPEKKKKKEVKDEGDSISPEKKKKKKEVKEEDNSVSPGKKKKKEVKDEGVSISPEKKKKKKKVKDKEEVLEGTSTKKEEGDASTSKGKKEKKKFAAKHQKENLV